MWRNYLTVGLRALTKNRTYAFINILGLSLGIAACLLILTYVRYEFTYDAWMPGVERAYKLDDSALRVTDAYARWVSRNKDAAAATGVYQAFDKKLARHPLVLEGIRETKAGKKLPPLVDSPQTGAAEALYGIGATLTRRGGEDLALVYLQLALYLSPNHPLALLSLADL